MNVLGNLLAAYGMCFYVTSVKAQQAFLGGFLGRPLPYYRVKGNVVFVSRFGGSVKVSGLAVSARVNNVVTFGRRK